MKLLFTEKEKIEQEKLLDGCYVIKTNASKAMNKENVVGVYQGLQKVEQAFKNMKTVLLELRMSNDNYIFPSTTIKNSH